MSNQKTLYVIKIEAKDSFQLAKYLLAISKMIHDGETDGTQPCYWDIIGERKV